MFSLVFLFGMISILNVAFIFYNYELIIYKFLVLKGSMKRHLSSEWTHREEQWTNSFIQGTCTQIQGRYMDDKMKSCFQNHVIIHECSFIKTS